MPDLISDNEISQRLEFPSLPARTRFLGALLKRSIPMCVEFILFGRLYVRIDLYRGCSGNSDLLPYQPHPGQEPQRRISKGIIASRRRHQIVAPASIPVGGNRKLNFSRSEKLHFRRIFVFHYQSNRPPGSIRNPEFDLIDRSHGKAMFHLTFYINSRRVFGNVVIRRRQPENHEIEKESNIQRGLAEPGSRKQHESDEEQYEESLRENKFHDRPLSAFSFSDSNKSLILENRATVLTAASV